MDMENGNRKKRTFIDLLEINLLDRINKAIKECQESLNAEPLVYDSHHNLLVAAFIVKGFLTALHYNETLPEAEIEFMFSDISYWINLIEKSKNTDEGVEDVYLKESLKNTPYEGPLASDVYTFIVEHNNCPYIPYWSALPIGHKALSVLGQIIKERDGGDV